MLNKNGAPAEKCADRGEKFQISAAHRFARNLQFAHDAGDAIDLIERQCFLADRDAIVVTLQRHISQSAAINRGVVAVQQQKIFFAREVIAPQTALFADDEFRIVACARPTERRWLREPNVLFSEHFFAALENEPENSVT